MTPKIAEIEYFRENGLWGWVIRHKDLVSRSDGYKTKADAQRSANETIKEMRKVYKVKVKGRNVSK